MIPTLQPSDNGSNSSNFIRINVDNYVSKEAQLNRNIQSYYLMAKSIVSKVSETDKKKKKLVLVVDDEPLTFQLIDEFLQEAGLNCEVITALSGQKAFDIATSVLPDLIITDWLIPEIDGLELIKKLKSNPVTKDVPIIMATGMIVPNEEVDFVLQSGALDYLRKPLDYAELSARVKAALAAGDSLREIKQQRESIHIKDQFVNFLIDTAPNPIFYQDKWGRFLGCNNKFELLFNKAKEEIIGKHAGEFLSKPIADVMEMHIASPLECGHLQNFKIELARPEGNKYLLFFFVGFGNATVDGVIGSITDITEIVQSSTDSLTRLEICHKKEKEQIASSVEKLQTELDFKHRELAMHLELLIHSRNVKEKLVEAVNKLQPYLTSDGKPKLFSLLKQLKWEINEEVDLNIEKKFDEANTELYSFLEKCCPEITRNEKRLCAYLKMNHCASDVAKITGKSLNSINVGLARLRAKLRLPNTKDLRMYLNEFDLPRVGPVTSANFS